MSITAEERILEEHQADEKTHFGFWVYLMTDCVLFASLFATYIVLHRNTAGGPSTIDIFDLPMVLTETIILLLSSFTCGLAVLAAHNQRKTQVIIWYAITFLLGATFLTMELAEFRHLITEGYSWQRSGFLSGFFTLVATHGLHIAAGLVWILVMLWQVMKKGLTRNTVRRLSILGMFWHFLDVVWIFIFTIVYLMGVIV
jgi:cytochrome o ubiquinol oxidase subunit 3